MIRCARSRRRCSSSTTSTVLVDVAPAIGLLAQYRLAHLRCLDRQCADHARFLVSGHRAEELVGAGLAGGKRQFPLRGRASRNMQLGCVVHVAGHVPATIFFFNDTATTEIYTLSLHDALPI